MGRPVRLSEADPRQDALHRARAARKYMRLIRWLKAKPSVGMGGFRYTDGGVRILWPTIFGDKDGPDRIDFASDPGNPQPTAAMEWARGGVSSLRLHIMVPSPDWQQPGPDKWENTLTAIYKALQTPAWREAFIHEYVHWIDVAQRGATLAGTRNPARGDSWASYYLSPLEFNAYFQQGASGLERDVASKLNLLRRTGYAHERMKAIFKAKIDVLLPDTARAFVATHTEPGLSAWDAAFVKNTMQHPEASRRFIKRLSVTYDHLDRKYRSRIARLGEDMKLAHARLIVLSEVFDQPARWSWDISPDPTFGGSASFYIGDAAGEEAEYTVMIAPERTGPSGEPLYYVAFHMSGHSDPDTWDRIQGMKQGTMAVTGTGEQFRVFSTVIDIMQAFDRKFDVGGWVFTAEESNRKRLYNTILKRMARKHGFEFSQQKGGREFVLTREPALV